MKATRVADDHAMVVGTNVGLQRIMDALNETSEEYNIRINRKKAKAMRLRKNIKHIYHTPGRGRAS